MVPWKHIIPVVALVAAGFGASALWGRIHRPQQVAYSQFVRELDGGRVASLSIQPGERITGRWRSARAGSQGAEFEVVYPQLDASSMLARAEKSSVPVSFDAPPDRERTKLLLSIVVPVILFGVAFYLIFLSMRGQGGNGDAQQVPMVMALIEAGFADRLMFSSDASRGYSKTLTVFLPKLKAAGATDDVLHRIMVDNPRRFLAFVPKRKR